MEVQHGIHEYWTGLPFPTPGNLPHPGIEPMSAAVEGRLSTTAPPGKSIYDRVYDINKDTKERRYFI